MTAYTSEQFETALEGVEEKKSSGRKTGSRLGIDDPRHQASRPELVVEALQVWPNNAETNPQRLDFVRAMAAIKAALGPQREDHYGDVLRWALGYHDNDGKFVRERWDSIKDAELGADWLFAQARPYGFVGDVQDDFAEPPYDPESFIGLDADGVRERIDELLILKFGWADAYQKVRDYLETMSVIDVAEVDALIEKRAPEYGITIEKERIGTHPKFLLLGDLSRLPETHDFVEELLGGNRRHRLTIRLADDRDHLLFRETRFAHCSLRIGSQSLT